MINLTELLDRAKKKALEKPDTKDGYAPKSTDELRFKKKHVVQKTDDRNGNKDDVFKATNVKTLERAKERHGYDVDDDQKVYEGYEVNEDSHTSHFRFLRHLQKAGVSAPSKADAMDMIAKHGDPDRAGQAYVKRINMIKAASNKVQKEEAELDEVLDTKAAKKKYLDTVLLKKQRSTTFQNEKEKRRYKPGGYVSKVSNKLYLQQYEELETEGEELEEAKRKKSPTEKLFNRLKNYGVKNPSAKPLVGNQTKLDKNNNGKIDAEDFKMLRKEEIQVDEVLNPSMGAGAYVSDFVHSKNPKFAGKSKKERMKQALAAYYSAKRGD